MFPFLQMKIWFVTILSIGILGYSFKPCAAIFHGRVFDDRRPSRWEVCPVCGRGPGTVDDRLGEIIGRPGVAEVEMASKGDINPTDPPEAHENRRPIGDDDEIGFSGDSGLSGQKGEPGETARKQVAFTVVRNTPSAVTRQPNIRLPFQQAKTLLDGTRFDLETGTFTCTVPGTYVFMFSVLRPSWYANGAKIRLWKNGSVIVGAESHERSPGGGQMSASAVLVLQQGDEVYLTYIGQAWGATDFYPTSFSGILLDAK